MQRAVVLRCSPLPGLACTRTDAITVLCQVLAEGGRLFGDGPGIPQPSRDQAAAAKAEGDTPLPQPLPARAALTGAIVLAVLRGEAPTA